MLNFQTLRMGCENKNQKNRGQYSGIIRMKKAEYLFTEEQPLLFPEKTDEREVYFDIPCNNVIAKGTINFLEKWPSQLYSVFLLGFSIISATFTFTLFTIFFCFPIGDYKYRETRNVEIRDSYNVYFIKHENRTWSRKELCYIETAAHKHPELNVYLINLVDSRKNNNSVSNEFIEMKNFSSFSNYVNAYNEDKDFAISTKLSSEMLLRNKIAYYNSNVRNVDISTQAFFKGSMLNSVYKNLSYKIIEIAAKANILWNYPGIALDPVMFNSLKKLKKYFCKTKKSVQDFIIDLHGNLQATNVSCQAFPEFLMQEINKNRLSDQHHELKDVLSDFCPRINDCLGVKILEETGNYLSNEISCPTISSDGNI